MALGNFLEHWQGFGTRHIPEGSPFDLRNPQLMEGIILTESSVLLSRYRTGQGRCTAYA